MRSRPSSCERVGRHQVDELDDARRVDRRVAVVARRGGRPPSPRSRSGDAQLGRAQRGVAGQEPVQGAVEEGLEVRARAGWSREWPRAGGGGRLDGAGARAGAQPARSGTARTDDETPRCRAHAARRCAGPSRSGKGRAPGRGRPGRRGDEPSRDVRAPVGTLRRSLGSRSARRRSHSARPSSRRRSRKTLKRELRALPREAEGPLHRELLRLPERREAPGAERERRDPRARAATTRSSARRTARPGPRRSAASACGSPTSSRATSTTGTRSRITTTSCAATSSRSTSPRRNPTHKLAEMRAYGGLSGSEYEAPPRRRLLRALPRVARLLRRPRTSCSPTSSSAATSCATTRAQIAEGAHDGGARPERRPALQAAPRRDPQPALGRPPPASSRRTADKLPAGSARDAGRRDRSPSSRSSRRSTRRVLRAAARRRLQDAALAARSSRPSSRRRTPTRSTAIVGARPASWRSARADRRGADGVEPADAAASRRPDVTASNALAPAAAARPSLEARAQTVKQYLRVLARSTDASVRRGTPRRSASAPRRRGRDRAASPRRRSRRGRPRARPATTAERVVEWAQGNALLAFAEVWAPWTLPPARTWPASPTTSCAARRCSSTRSVATRLDDFAAGGRVAPRLLRHGARRRACARSTPASPSARSGWPRRERRLHAQRRRRAARDARRARARGRHPDPGRGQRALARAAPGARARHPERRRRARAYREARAARREAGRLPGRDAAAAASS